MTQYSDRSANEIGKGRSRRPLLNDTVLRHFFNDFVYFVGRRPLLNDTVLRPLFGLPVQKLSQLTYQMIG